MNTSDDTQQRYEAISPFEYFLMLSAIIAGLIFTQILSSLIVLLKNASHVTFYWLPLGWAVLMLFLVLQWWWTFRTWQSVINKGRFRLYRDLVIVLLVPIFIFCASAFLFPDVEKNAVVDLKAYYFTNRAFFMGFSAAAVLQLGIIHVLYVKFQASRQLVRALSVLSLVMCAVSENPTLHACTFVLNSALLAFFIWSETSPLHS